jgi:hypothetical protein
VFCRGYDRDDLGIVRAETGSVEDALAVRAIDNVCLTADRDLVDVEIHIVSDMNLIGGVEAHRGVAFDVGRYDRFGLVIDG